MVFSSITFLLFYLPLVLLIYHLLFLPVTLGHSRKHVWRRLSNLFLLAVSLLFYFWGEPLLLWVIIASTLIDYVCGLVICGGLTGPVRPLEPGGGRKAYQRFGVIFSIVSNLAFLGFFKYFNFGIDSLNHLLAGTVYLDVARVTLPLGISFYIFQSMSYTIDVYRGHVKATRNLIDFACYVTLFPQLVAGLVVRYCDVAEQLLDRSVTVRTFASGITRFVLGLGKKVLIANSAAVIADHVFAQNAGNLSAPAAWTGMIAYAVQIYFDFSGYSDMAIGLGRMFGFEFLENFNYPYTAVSVQDFWRRWHISLSTWFRDYLYIPLGGSRGSLRRTYFNLFAVFFLCGLWHGASWTFAAWGLYHGAFLAVERAGLGRILERLPRPVRHAYTLLAVLGGWVLFRAETFGQAAAYFGALSGAGGPDGIPAGLLTPDILLGLGLGVFLSAPILPGVMTAVKRVLNWSATQRQGVWADGLFAAGWVSVIFGILLVSLASLASGTHNPFIYFRF